MNTAGLESVRAAPFAHAARAARTCAPIAAALASLLPGVSSLEALLVGIGAALIFGNPWAERTRALAHMTLAWSVAGLGAGMNLVVVARTGAHGLGYTALGIGGALLLGAALGRWLRVARDTSLLITVGTAICGGSAIAAVAPVIRAKDDEVSVALVIVFLLNGVALWIFPVVGRYLHMGEHSFGLWCALAIHDTSSVIGAASQFGTRALEVATATKLARALWIVPVTFAIAFVRARAGVSSGEGAGKAQFPWFIGAFLAIAGLVTFVPSLRSAGTVVSAIAHRSLALTLFLVGFGFSRVALRRVGLRPLALAATLWIALASGSLALIATGLLT